LNVTTAAFPAKAAVCADTKPIAVMQSVTLQWRVGLGHKAASGILSSPCCSLVDLVRRWGDGRGLGCWAISGEQQSKRVLVDILVQFMEDTLNVSGGINAPFLRE